MDKDAQIKYELLKEKQKKMKFTKKWMSNSLFMECIDLFENYIILSQEESEDVFRTFQTTFPIRYGRIDWEKVPINIKISIEDIEKFNYEKQYLILWDDINVPCVQCSLRNIIDNLDDVLAVSFNTWLFSVSKDEIIEFYHENEIEYGKINSK